MYPTSVISACATRRFERYILPIMYNVGEDELQQLPPTISYLLMQPVELSHSNSTDISGLPSSISTDTVSELHLLPSSTSSSITTDTSVTEQGLLSSSSHLFVQPGFVVSPSTSTGTTTIEPEPLPSSTSLVQSVVVGCVNTDTTITVTRNAYEVSSDIISI